MLWLIFYLFSSCFQSFLTSLFINFDFCLWYDSIVITIFIFFIICLFYYYEISFIFLFIHILLYYLLFIIYFRDKRQPLDDIVQVSFPILQTLMTQLLDNNTLAAASVMRLCLKIFWSATIYHLPAAQGRFVLFECIVLY